MPLWLLGLLAIGQWVALGILLVSLTRRHWWTSWRQRVMWVVPAVLGVAAVYSTTGIYSQAPMGPPILDFFKLWCLKGKWLLLFLMGFGVRQPLDDHMMSQWPGVLAALGLNQEACEEAVEVPEYRRYFHAVYRAWCFVSSPGSATLQHAVRHDSSPTAGSFSKASAALVCHITFAASQLLLAFGGNCLLVLRREWSDRTAYLSQPQLRHQAIRVHFNRLSDVFSILLLEAAVFLLVVE